jgi:hypothetical protein
MANKALLFLVPLLLIACSQNRVVQLTDRADAYNRSLKWGSMATAGSLIAEANRRTLMETIGRRLKDFPIVDFSVLDLSVEPGNRKGSALVEFSYYGNSDQTLRYRQEIQVWQWDSAKGDWFLLEARDVPQKKN